MESDRIQSSGEITPKQPSPDDSFIDEYLNNIEGNDRDSSLDEPFSFLESTESEMLISKEPLFPIDGSKKTSQCKDKMTYGKTAGVKSSNEKICNDNVESICLQNDNTETDCIITKQNTSIMSDPSHPTKPKLDLPLISCSPIKLDKEFHSINTTTTHSLKNLLPSQDKPVLDISWLCNGIQPFNITDMTFEQFQLLYYQHLFKNTKDEPSQQQKPSKESDEISSKFSKPATQPTKPESDIVSGSTLAPSVGKSCTDTPIKNEYTDKKVAIDKSKETTGFTYRCSRCDEVFRSRLELTAHDKRAHAVDWNSDLQCHTCKKKFSSKYYLNQHELTHKGDLPFSCDLCEKRFLCKGTLETHVILLHTNNRPFKCDECGAAFKLKKILIRHVSTHTKEAPYKCACCDKRFSRRGSLNRHELIHTGIKPFQCKVCEKRFTQKSTLTLHMMGHTDERPYQCLKCSKSFRKKSHLTRHDSVHSGKKRHYYYECKVCKKCFAEKYCLVEHEITHAGDSVESSAEENQSNGIPSGGLVDKEIDPNSKQGSDL